MFPITSSFRGRYRFHYLKFSKRRLAKWINIKGTKEQIAFLTRVPVSMGLKDKCARSCVDRGQLDFWGS